MPRRSAVNGRHRGNAAVLAAVEAFSEQHGTAVLWMDDLLDEGAAPAARR
jgi:methionyl-tRNA formyltransferase